MNYDQPGTAYTNSGTVSDGARITAAGVRLTNSDSGRIVGGVEFTVGGGRFVNELGGQVRLNASSPPEAVIALTGSSGADTVFNAGLIFGRIVLGDGDDRLTDRDVQTFGIDLGAGDDVYRVEGATYRFPNADGGSGSDRIVLATTAFQVDGRSLRGFEHATFETPGNISNFSGYQTITLGAAGISNFYNFVTSANPAVDLALAGQYIYLQNSSLRSVTGTDGVEAVSVDNGAVISGDVRLGAGNDIVQFQVRGDGALGTVGGVADGGAGVDQAGFNLLTDGLVRSIDLARVTGFEQFWFNTGYVNSVAWTVANASGATDVRVGRGASVTLVTSNLSAANVDAVFGATLTIDRDSVVGRIGAAPTFDQRVDLPQGDTALSSNIIVNGRVVGEVRMYTGDDVVDLRGGSVGGTIYGNAGNDTLLGGAGAERMDGGFGADMLEGNAGDDVLVGGGGSDRLAGGAGNDSLAGDAGADMFDGGEGDDALRGGTGTGEDIIDGGAGSDTLTFTAARATYTFTNTDNVLRYTSATEGNGRVANVETFQFADGSFTLAQLIASISPIVPPPPDYPPLPTTDQFTLIAGTAVQGSVIGTGRVAAGGPGVQDITVLDYAGRISFGATFNEGGDRVRLNGAAASWTIRRSGSSAEFSDGDTVVTLPAGTVGVDVIFNDGVRTLKINAAGTDLAIGAQTITTTATAITERAGPATATAAVDPSLPAQLVLSGAGPVVAIGNERVAGSPTLAETVYVAANGKIAFGATFNAGGDTIVLPGALSGYSASRSGSTVLLTSTGESVSIAVGTVGSTIRFADGAQGLLRFDETAGQVKLGTAVIGTTLMQLTTISAHDGGDIFGADRGDVAVMPIHDAINVAPMHGLIA